MISASDQARFFLEVSCAIETRPNDLDVLGHVNNAVALEYLEAARWDWAKRMGLEATGRQMIVVVTRIEIDYVAEIAPGKIGVRTTFVSPGPDWLDDDNYKAQLRQTIFRRERDGDLVRATVSLAFMDAATRLLCTLQDVLAPRSSRAPRTPASAH